MTSCCNNVKLKMVTEVGDRQYRGNDIASLIMADREWLNRKGGRVEGKTKGGEAGRLVSLFV